MNIITGVGRGKSSRCVAALALACIVTSFCTAESISACDGILVPSVDKVKHDYKLIQSYLKVHSRELYERYKNGQVSGIDSGGAYGVYSGFLKGSHSADEFKEKVDKELEIELYNGDEAASNEYFRSGVSEAQVEKWVQCVGIVAGKGSLLLTTTNAAEDGFNLAITWTPQQGVPEADLELVLVGATINGKTELRETIKGGGTIRRIVQRISKASVRVVANIPSHSALVQSLSDSLYVPLTPTEWPDPIIIPQNEVQLGNTFASAPLNDGSSFTHRGSIVHSNGVNGSDPHYRIKVRKPGLLTADLQSQTTGKTMMLQILNDKGAAVATPMPGVALAQQKADHGHATYHVPKAGEYVIRTQPYEDGPYDYIIEVTFRPDK